MLVYDPINLEKVPADDYLKNDANNIVIVYDNKAYGVNKALFMFNNEMKRCLLANNALLKKATYDNPETFYNIGYFIGKKVIVSQDKLNDVLKKHRVIELTSKTTGYTYINKELLELTTIGLIKPVKKSMGKVNFQYAYEDVYFDELISKLLHEYSGSLYSYINYSLLNPEYFDNNEPLEKYLTHILLHTFKVAYKEKYKNIDFKNALNKAVTDIDKAFIEAAPRYENTYIHKVFYRGMIKKYINTNGDELENVGDTALIVNYTSVSSKKSVAKTFTGNIIPGIPLKTPIYIIYLEEGLPFINMVSNTQVKKEKEYLLPRNIIFELISVNGREYTVLAKPFKPDQFTIKTGCFSLDTYDIAPTTLPATSPANLSLKKSQISISKGKNIDADFGKSKDNVKPVKLKRCPNGMVRIKKTNECVPKLDIKQKVKPKSPKANLGRCPNGTRRNPKTLLCETRV